jgi:hypothetical protein
MHSFPSGAPHSVEERLMGELSPAVKPREIMNIRIRVTIIFLPITTLPPCMFLTLIEKNPSSQWYSLNLLSHR